VFLFITATKSFLYVGLQWRSQEFMSHRQFPSKIILKSGQLGYNFFKLIAIKKSVFIEGERVTHNVYEFFIPKLRESCHQLQVLTV
jgi:hypothetical protein